MQTINYCDDKSVCDVIEYCLRNYFPFCVCVRKCHMSVSSAIGAGGGRLRLVPPGGKYVAPFYFAAYYGGDASQMLFSPHSSSPSGYYEGGGQANLIDPSDPILQDCKMLLTVSEVMTNESIITAQEAPLGRKVQLPNGQYRVVAQLLSFNGHVFASTEARYHVVEAFDMKPDGTYQYTGEGTSHSGLFDTLLNVQRNGGLPTGRTPSTLTGKGGSLLQVPSKNVLPPHHSKPSAGGSVRSPSGATLSDHVAATVRQSEEALQHAVSHFGAAAAETAGRISRQSSLDSRGGGGGGAGSSYPSSPHQKPPALRASNTGRYQGAVSGSSSSAHDAQQAAHQHHTNEEGGPLSSGGEEGGEDDVGLDGARSRRFLVPPPSLLYAGAPLLVVLRPTASLAPVMNVLLQGERGSGGRSGNQRHNSQQLTRPSMSTVAAQRLQGIAVPARGVQLHWVHRAPTHASAAALVPNNRGSSLQLRLPSDDAALGAPSSRTSTMFSAVIVSEESFGPTGPDGVLGGAQFCVGPPVIPQLLQHSGGALAQPSGDMRILLSIRPQRPTPFVSCLPYIDLELLTGGVGRAGGGFLDDRGAGGTAVPSYHLSWKVSSPGNGDAKQTHPQQQQQQQQQGDHTIYEATVTAHDVIALFFAVEGDEPATMGPRRRGTQTHPPLHAVLSINYRPVCRLPVPAEAAHDFSASNPLRHVRCTPPTNYNTVGSSPSTVEVVRGITALSHYTMDADVLYVPGEDLVPPYEDHHHQQQTEVLRRTLYLWEQGDSLLDASRHEIAVATTAMASIGAPMAAGTPAHGTPSSWR